MTEPIHRCCDLVMKGGITSGVVYPAAVEEVARRFHLVGIGGTSAGAIAACLAAAAEYRRRQTGSFEGFRQLAGLAEELAEEGRLLELFRPDRETRGLFRQLLRLMGGGGGLRGFFSRWGNGFGLGARLLFRRERTFRRIVDNGFGLVSGMANGNRADGSSPLTEWLADKVDRIADKSGAPLTYRDLHTASVPQALKDVLGEAPERSIDLRCVSTSLSFGRPVELPLTENIFAFDPEEWRRLFPERIVSHLEKAAEEIDAPALAVEGKLPVPNLDMPVVVGARMSLSFPGLFSLVPLWARNYHREDEAFERVWMSDGGITSNFPVHRFDAVHPQWPTLAINLQYEENEGAGPQRRSLVRDELLVYLPKRRQDGVLDLWNHFDHSETSKSKLLGFLFAIFQSAQTWHDNAFLKLPGFRDRLAEIWMLQGEGGLALDMEPDTVRKLAERGRDAGRRLAERFADTPPEDAMSWQGHRWVRFRSAMAGLMETLQDFKDSVDAPMTGDPPLLELLADRQAPPTAKFQSEAQRDTAERITEKLLDLAEEIRALDVCTDPQEVAERPFCGGPRPRVEIGTRAPI